MTHAGSSERTIWEELIHLLEKLGEPLFAIGTTEVTPLAIIVFIALIGVAFVVSAALQRLLTRVYRRRRVEEGVQHALNRLLHYVVIAIGVLMAVDNLGVSLATLAAVGGVLLVGIGFGLQDLAKNFVSGIILLIERPISKGDFIEVDAYAGTVMEINLRTTLINTYDDVEILIPNGKLVTNVVVNRMHRQQHYRIRVNVGVAYSSDTKQVRDILIEVAKAHPDVLDEPGPIVFFENFGDSALDFRLMGWLADARLEPRVRSDLRFAVDAAFREAGIEMAFPQLDLHLRTGWESAREDAKP